MPEVVGGPDRVTTTWLTEVLRTDGAIGPDTEVVGASAAAIGTGQVGDNFRFALDYDGPTGPASVVCKFGSSDPASAAAGVSMGLYETEVAFYRELAPTLDVSRPYCYFAAVTPGTADAVVVLEDLAPATQGDQIAGCDPAQAALAVEEAAKLHGPRWGDPTLAELGWLRRETGGGLGAMLPFIWDSFVERYRSTLDPITLETGLVAGELASIADSRAGRPKVPAHSDFRIDNMLFGTAEGGHPLAVVDWQTVQLGVATRDVAYFFGNAFEPEVRRACEQDLVASYHRSLVEDYGVSDYPFDECWADYVSFSYSSLVMAVFASMVVGRTDRGDAMFMAMANRSAQMGADLDAPSVIRSA